MTLSATAESKRAAFMTLGCKVNAYETQAVAGMFRRRGYRIVGFDEEADVYVINTCSVTSTGAAKIASDDSACHPTQSAGHSGGHGMSYSGGG